MKTNFEKGWFTGMLFKIVLLLFINEVRSELQSGDVELSTDEKTVYSSVGFSLDLVYLVKFEKQGDEPRYPKLLRLDSRPKDDTNKINLLLEVEFDTNEQTIVKSNFDVYPAYKDRLSLKEVTKTKITFSLDGVVDSDFDRKYRCTAEYTVFVTPYESIKLLKAEPPVILHANFFTQASLKMGSDKSYICRAEGKPTPTVSWLRKGKEVSKNDQGMSVLKIAGAKINDSDEYICKAENVGGAVKKAMYFMVTYIELDGEGLRTKHVDEGEAIVERCNIDGHPTTNYKWYGPQNTIILQERELNYRNVGAGDYGNYTCVANNTVDVLKSVLTVRPKVLAPGTILSSTGANGQLTGSAVVSKSTFLVIVFLVSVTIVALLS